MKGFFSHRSVKCTLTDRYHSVCVIVPIVGEVVIRMPPWSKLATSGGIHDEQDTAHESEDEHCTGQDIFGRISLDQWRNQDGSDTLKRLIETCQDAHALKGDGNVRPVCKVVIPIGRKRNDGSVESLESEFIHHDTGDVYGDIPSLDRRVNVPCFPYDSIGSDHGDVWCTKRAVMMLREATANPGMQRDLVYTSTMSERWC